MKIRPAEHRDAIDMWGSTYQDTVRALAIEDQGELLAITGLRYSVPVMCFCDARPGLKRSPKTILKAARQVTQMVSEADTDVFALADEDEPTSMNFLSHIGFEHIHGRLYKWPRQ